MPKAQVFLKRLQCSVGSTLEGVLPGVAADARRPAARGPARPLRELPGNLWGFVLMGGRRLLCFRENIVSFGWELMDSGGFVGFFSLVLKA